MIETPKKRFMSRQDDVGYLAQLSSQQPFLRALDYAMLQMQHELPSTPEYDLGNTCHQRMAGAKQFINILLSLHEVPREPTTTTNANLKPI